MRDDCLQVDELLLQLADYKNDYADVAAEKLLKKCSTSWEADRSCKTACTILGSPIAPGSRCGGLSDGYKCSCTNGTSTAGRMNQVKNTMTLGQLSTLKKNRMLS